MALQKSFGKLGNRAMARLATGLEAGLVLPDRRVSCILENISRKGCRLALAEPPRIGTTVLVCIDRIEALGDVKWVREQCCGIAFESPIETAALERVRWAVENAIDHEKAKLSSSTAIWR
jgi:hypothetical protein